MAANYLKLNDSKTEFIVFGSKKNLAEIKTQSMCLGESHVPSHPSVKNIGVHLDETLKMDKQVAATCKVAWFHLYQISKIRKYLTDDQTKSVIHANVTSRLDHNNSLLIGLPKKSIGKLQLIQNAAARLIVGLKKRDHVTPTLRELHWLPVEQRILFKVMLLTFKALNNKGPAYLKELLTPYVPARNLRSSSDNQLCVPKSCYVETSKRAFGTRAPCEWNRLPISIRNKPSVNSFKTALKTYLFKQAYG